MRKMKDSGIEWIGLIPSDWDVLKLKQLCSMPITDGTHKTPEYTDESDGVPFLSSKDVTSGKIDWTNIKHITKDLHKILHKEIAVKRNDVLLAKNGTTGIAALVDCDTVFDIYVTLAVLRPNQKIVLPNYLIYIVNSAVSKIQFDEHLIGIGVPNLHLNVINGVKALVPPIDEQKKIADFLDEKCGEIDSIRSDIQKQIDILNDYKKSVITEAVTKGLNPKAKLKDSGIEWIGKIPEGWCVKKLKYVFAEGEFGLKIGPFGSALKDCVIANGDYKVYNQAHVISNDFSLSRHFVSEETYNRLYSYRVLPDDILFSMMGTIGKCRIMPRGYPKGIMDSHLLKARLKNFILPSFFQYVYDKDNSTIIYTQLEQYANGTIMNGLNSSIIKKLIMPVPPLSEQKAIADYLDEKCSEINATIADKQTQLETLDEYKKSLIFEYVTGKKEVPA